jgi:hypothetical protein
MRHFWIWGIRGGGGGAGRVTQEDNWNYVQGNKKVISDKKHFLTSKMRINEFQINLLSITMFSYDKFFLKNLARNILCFLMRVLSVGPGTK